MREIKADIIIDIVKNMCIDANYNLCDDIYSGLCKARENEEEKAATVLCDMIKNADIAKKECMPICQDTGMAIFFVSVGQDVRIVGGGITDAVNEGVRRGYKEGYLRKSVVAHPLNRANTGDNTPAIIHYDIVEGDKIEIVFTPKGFGSENMSRLKMLKPSDGKQGVVDFVIDTVKAADANPCPPIVVGVGIGGDMEKACIMAKYALTRDINEETASCELENEILNEINSLGIGPSGYGGKTTALAVNIETYPTHIAGLPVAVNISCHVTRHKREVI